MAFTGELRPFQVEAFDRMVERRKVMVAYEMGLGKTILSIATIEHLLEAGEVESGLVIVPSSLKYQWLRQINAFTDGARAIVIDGTPAQRAKQYARAHRYEYIILNYEQVLNDWQHVRHLPRDYIILDEATAIKNASAKRTRRIAKLNAPYKYALTGQPVENKAEEAFAVMSWVDPTVLGRFDIFDSTFIVRNAWGKVLRYKNLPTLHKALKGAMVRKKRTDPDVRDQMPRVSEEVVTVDFDRPGAALYRSMANDLLDELAQAVGQFGNFDLWSHYHGGDDAGSEVQGRIMSKLTCLRMLCDTPELLRISANKYDTQATTGIGAGSAYASELLDDGRLDKVLQLDKQSPKLKATVELVEELLDANPDTKVVVFAFFKDALRLIQDATSHLTKSVLFMGDMNAKEKDAAKETFTHDPECRLFLSSDSGGYGLDLPNANYLISFDLPWSAGKLDQRNARIIRLSSEFEAVTVIYMLMAGSVEEWQLDKLDKKRAIGSAIMDGKGATAKGTLEMDSKGLIEHLKTAVV